MVSSWVPPLALAVLVLGCSGPTLGHLAETRLANAEAEMKACQERLGLGAVPTPTTTALYDATRGPDAQDPAQVRIKTLCGIELRDLLEARRILRELRHEPTKE